MSKVIFLDIDGVLITERCYLAFLEEGSKFPCIDNVGSRMIQRLLLKDPELRVVLISTMRKSRWDFIEEFFETKLFGSGFFHEDWRTDPEGKIENRANDILEWLGRHPEVTHWIVLDDMPMDLDNSIHVDRCVGISVENIIQASVLLWGK